MKIIFAFYLMAICMSCNSQLKNKSTPGNYATIGKIERFDAALDLILDTTARAEIIADGLDWSEGPVWVEKHKMLLFSDVPRDTIFKWTAAKGKEVYLTPSGYTGSIPRGGEMGSNGLILDSKGNLVLCQCGNRQMAKMNAPLNSPKPNYTALAANYNGKKFNSPNDAVYHPNGDLYFTDPPYGLEKHMNDPAKEIPFQGVYKVKTNGEVVLITDTLTRPNGIAFLADGKTLIVANSDPSKPNWYAFELGENDRVVSSRIFYSAAGTDRSLRGLPDGMKTDKKGNVYATGPGGIWIFNSEAKLLGKIRLDKSASNLALSADEKTMYITNDNYVLRLIMKK